MTSSQVNGHMVAVADHDAQVAFYDQWLRLKDAVLADRHPRFKLPVAAKERLPPLSRTTPSSVHVSAHQLPGLSHGVVSAHGPSDGMGGSTAVANAQAFALNTSAVASGASSKKGIDPVLLTKSEDLIRAELHLKRQRIERQLKDAADHRKQGPRYRDNEETAPLATLTDALQTAFAIVKPISGLEDSANAQVAASDSFDENSYYSSQANDWSSEEGSPKNRKPATAVTSQQTTALASSASLSKNVPTEIERLEKQPQTLNRNETEAIYNGEREDSEEYSPPAADAFSGPDGDVDAMDLDDGKCHVIGSRILRLSGPTDSSEFVPQDAHVPSPQVSLVTNHLTQLAAPQPARVSPLAVAKPPSLAQPQNGFSNTMDLPLPASPYSHHPTSAYRQQFASDESTTSPRGSAQTSPAGLTRKQKSKNKKRKRESDGVAQKARKNRNRPVKPSPEPYIKPEPVSPPPMAAALQPARSRPYQMPSDVEIVPGPQQTAFQESSHSAIQYGSHGVSSPSVVRVASPAAYARPRRDDQDLRRVASLHAAQRPVSPMARAYSPASYRTVSQPFPERSTRYGEESVRVPQMHYVRTERSMSPRHLRTAREVPVHSMAPPPLAPVRRIVVDQYGNRFYANEPEQHTRMSVAPQPAPDSEVIYERVPSRQSTMYPSQPAQGIYEDSNGLRMLPPPPPVRRVAERVETAPNDYRQYRQREYSRAPELQYYREETSAPVYIRDAPGPRASVYPPEAAPTGSYAPRAYSMRPEMEPIRYMSRQPSMAPQAEYVRVAEAGARPPPPPPPPVPMRAVSVIPGSEYAAPPETRYGYAHAANQYGGPGQGYVEESAGGQREIYVDEYGREIRMGY